jgi:hypothetical protein
MGIRTPITAAACVLAAMAASACSSSSKPSAAVSTSTQPSGSTAGGTSTTPGGSSGASSSTVNVCSLITPAQASSITGVAYTGANPSSGPTTATCTYTGTAAPTPMTVTVTSNASGAAAWTEELGTLQEGGGETPSTINGLGDRAAFSVGTLGTQSGNWIVQVDGGDSTSTPAQGNTKSIAVARALITALH